MDTKKEFICINTIAYNGEMAHVTAFDLAEVEDLGFSKEQGETFAKLNVGDCIDTHFLCGGVYVMKVC